MWGFKFGLNRVTPEQAQRELEQDELKEVLDDIAASLRGIDDSLVKLAEDSYRARMGRTE